MVVTISREYGALGGPVSRGLAARLGCRILDQNLPVVVAARLGTSPDVVEGLGRSRGFGERLLRSFNTAVPEIFQPADHHDDLDAEAQREIERLVREAADEGNVVIVGRVANVILGPRAGVLRVFLCAPLPWRIERVMESLGVDAANARIEILRVDAARRDYASHTYDFAWGDRRYYDIVLDVSRFGVPDAISLLYAATESVRA